MSDTFHERSVKASRRLRRCDWCGELIEIRQPYESYRWRDGSDGGTVLMHPECLQAMERTSREEGGWIDWDRGENVRGKSWGEAAFGVDPQAIDAAIAPSGQASADYAEHGKRSRGMRVSQWLSVYGSDKVSTHNYGSFYDGLFARLKPTALLEIGVYRGQSLHAWRAAGVGRVLGIDRDPTQSRCGEVVIYGEMPQDAAALAKRVGPLDLIIDDGSHLYPDYTATAEVLQRNLYPGGVYVIEDIQTQDSVDALRRDGWTIEDWREKTGRYDDVIAWRVRE